MGEMSISIPSENLKFPYPAGMQEIEFSEASDMIPFLTLIELHLSDH